MNEQEIEKELYKVDCGNCYEYWHGEWPFCIQSCGKELKDFKQKEWKADAVQRYINLRMEAYKCHTQNARTAK